MGEHTGVEWCHHTFNLVWGCQKVSPGCAHCYAEGQARRFGQQVWGPAATTPRRTFGASYWAQPHEWNYFAERSGTRARVFCASMADVFEDHPTVEQERAKLWPLIRETPWLDWLLLTKRPERIVAALPDDWGSGYPNVWMGTSVESQDYLWRVEALSEVPAAVRFLSCEPLLGPVDLVLRGQPLTPLRVIDWVIAGGESGRHARPCALEWLATLRDDCALCEIPFFLKQLGGHPDKRGGAAALLEGARHHAFPTVSNRLLSLDMQATRPRWPRP